MMLQSRSTRWTVTLCFLGMGLSGLLLFPMEGSTDPGGTLSHHGEHQRDVASWTFRLLLHAQKDINLSADQVGRIEALALDYAKTRIRNRAAVELAEVDVRAFIKNPQSELSAIEAALHKSESMNTAERLDRVKAIRAALTVLTSDQREAWRIRMHERHKDGQHRATRGNAPDRYNHPLRYENPAGGSAPHETAFLEDVSDSDGGAGEWAQRLATRIELP